MSDIIQTQPQLNYQIIKHAYCAECLFPENTKIPILSIPYGSHPLESCLRPIYNIIFGTSIDHCQCSFDFCPFGMIAIPFSTIAIPISILECVFCNSLTGYILGGVAGGSLCCCCIVDRIYRNNWVTHHAKEWSIKNNKPPEEAHYPVGRHISDLCSC